jgi:hypothetical protein
VGAGAGLRLGSNAAVWRGQMSEKATSQRWREPLVRLLEGQRHAGAYADPGRQPHGHLAAGRRHRPPQAARADGEAAQASHSRAERRTAVEAARGRADADDLGGAG